MIKDPQQWMPPLPLGTKVPGYGAIGGVGVTGGERYYWIVDGCEDVAMMPASFVEPWVAGDSASAGANENATHYGGASKVER